MQLMLRWVLSALALYITVKLAEYLGLRVWLAPGMKGVIASVIAVALLAIVNAVVRPIVTLLTLPLTCLTLGLFSFVVNAMMFWLVGQIVPGFRVKGFLGPLFASVVMGVVSGILSSVVISDGDKKRSRART
jgi:putative membrane protein